MDHTQRGWTYYDISFGIKDGQNVSYYGGRLVVRMDADGKNYVYDANIYNQITTKKEVPPPPTKQGDFEKSSNEKISNNAQNVKQIGMLLELKYR